MRIAVLGCGSIGRRHLRNLLALGETDLVAFDPSPDARALAAGETRARYVDSLAAVWSERPQAVLVTSPPAEHVALAREAAAHGCHLFIEKPLSHSTDGLESLAAEVERRGLVTMVGCNMRFHAGPRAVKALLDEGAVGTVLTARIYAGSYLPDWRPGTDYRRGYSANAATGGGAILDYIHELDLALWYCGAGEPVSCATVPATSIGLQVEGAAEIIVRHASGALSSVHVSYIQRDYRRGCEIAGTEGTVTWDFDEPHVRAYRPGAGWRTLPHPADWTLNRMYVDEMSHFLRHARAGEPTCCPLDQGWAALRLALGARAMAEMTEAPPEGVMS